jgi:hypothetical protein
MILIVYSQPAYTKYCWYIIEKCPIYTVLITYTTPQNVWLYYTIYFAVFYLHLTTIIITAITDINVIQIFVVTYNSTAPHLSPPVFHRSPPQEITLLHPELTTSLLLYVSSLFFIIISPHARVLYIRTTKLRVCIYKNSIFSLVHYKDSTPRRVNNGYIRPTHRVYAYIMIQAALSW